MSIKDQFLILFITEPVRPGSNEYTSTTTNMKKDPAYSVGQRTKPAYPEPLNYMSKGIFIFISFTHPIDFHTQLETYFSHCFYWIDVRNMDNWSTRHEHTENCIYHKPSQMTSLWNINLTKKDIQTCNYWQIFVFFGLKLITLQTNNDHLNQWIYQAILRRNEWKRMRF